MNAIISKITEITRKLGYYAIQYGYVGLHWMLSRAKVQVLQKWRRCSARKEVQKAYAGLGAEVYKAFRLGQDSDWAGLPDVQQQLKRVQEVESTAFQVDAAAEQIYDDFRARKAELKARYASKRQAATGRTESSGGGTASGEEAP
jgi:hypothetical protein